MNWPVRLRFALVAAMVGWITLACAPCVTAQGNPGTTGNWLEYRQVNPVDTKSFELVPVPAVPGAITGDVRADKLIRSGFDAMERKDYDSALESLNKAKALNPEQLGLWSVYGLIAVQRKSYSEAAADLQKELDLHPSQTRLYPLLTAIETKLGRKQDLLASYRAWFASGTTNPYVVTELMEMLIADGDPYAAITAGRSAMARLPEAAKRNVPFRLALAHAQLSVGEMREGGAALDALMSEANSTELNDTANDLANGSLDLELAERCARTALEKLTQESNTWTIDVDSPVEQEKSREIIAVWDTLGWTLEREGKLDEARSYLQAAWLGQTNIETGKHLGDLLAALGDKTGALTTYEDALATQPRADSLDARTEPSLEATVVMESVEALRREGVQSTTSGSENRIAKLHLVPLGPSNGLSCEAEYRLLLKAGRIANVQPTKGKPVPGVEPLLTKADIERYFPSGSQASLVRSGYVNCHSGICGLMLEP